MSPFLRPSCLAICSSRLPYSSMPRTSYGPSGPGSPIPQLPQAQQVMPTTARSIHPRASYCPQLPQAQQDMPTTTRPILQQQIQCVSPVASRMRIFGPTLQLPKKRTFTQIPKKRTPPRETPRTPSKTPIGQKQKRSERWQVPSALLMKLTKPSAHCSIRVRSPLKVQG